MPCFQRCSPIGLRRPGTAFRARGSRLSSRYVISARTAEFEGYGALSIRSLVHYLSSHDQQHLAGMQWPLGKIEAARIGVL
jgi:hypothetical protein